MRHLSFALVVALFFSYFVIALPTGSRKEEENTSLTHAPPSPPLERRAGQVVRAPKGGSRRLASHHVCFFISTMIWPLLTLLQHTTHASGKPASKKVQNRPHATPVPGTEHTHNAGNPNKNPDPVPDKANTYLPVYVVHYRREKDPYHWSIFVEKNAETLSGAIFDIQGTPGNFVFKMRGMGSMRRSGAYAGRVHVGNTLGTDKNLGGVERALREVVIHKDEKGWNCQNWVLEGLAKLTEKKLLVLDKDVPHHLSEAEIREKLSTQK